MSRDRISKIMIGLREAIEYERGNGLKVRTTDYGITIDGKGRMAIENKKTGLIRILPIDDAKR